MAGSSLAQKVQVGDNITTMISFQPPKYYNQSTVYVNLTVAGFAELTDNGYSFLTNNNGGNLLCGGFRLLLLNPVHLAARHLQWHYRSDMPDYQLGKYATKTLEHHLRQQHRRALLSQ